MKKLVKGIVQFRNKLQPAQKELFARLALGQTPDSLLIACSDSRVAPNVFASTDPGDLFVVRNVGNMIPPCGEKGHSSADESEAAAIEFALTNLPVKDIIVCGHSECGAIQAIFNGREKLPVPNLKSWLRHGEESLKGKNLIFDKDLSEQNKISQKNVLLQIEHLKSYPLVQKKIKQGSLKLHAWWFELKNADVHAYEEEQNKFVVIDEAEAERILLKLN